MISQCSESFGDFYNLVMITTALSSFISTIIFKKITVIFVILRCCPLSGKRECRQRKGQNREKRKWNGITPINSLNTDRYYCDRE